MGSGKQYVSSLFFPWDGNKTVFSTSSQILNQMLIPHQTSYVVLFTARSKSEEQLHALCSKGVDFFDFLIFLHVNTISMWVICWYVQVKDFVHLVKVLGKFNWASFIGRLLGKTRKSTMLNCIVYTFFNSNKMSNWQRMKIQKTPRCLYKNILSRSMAFLGRSLFALISLSVPINVWGNRMFADALLHICLPWGRYLERLK